MQNAYLYLQKHPLSKVLLVTSEVLSPLLDPQNFDTHIIFSDGATATILCGEDHLDSCSFLVNEPILSGSGEPLDSLYVPTVNSSQNISMKGRKVFTKAVKKMASVLNQVCTRENIKVADLDLVIPHQANQRIIDAIAKKIGSPEKVASNIKHHGNTSSSSIPIYLAENWSHLQNKNTLALTAFGGGFTYAAAILHSLRNDNPSQ